MQHLDFELTAGDGVRLHGRTWQPETEPRGTVCLVHGLGEHSGRYAHVGRYLNGSGYAVLVMDLRGHGTSEGKRGHSPGYDTLMSDITLLLRQAERLHADRPVFLYGHSMGGNLVLNYLLRHTPTPKGAIATAPLLRTAFAPPAWKTILMRAMLRLWPSMSVSSGLCVGDLSHDPEVIRAYNEDPLVHDRLTPRFLGILEAGLWAVNHAHTLSIPLLIMHGDSDRVTSTGASIEFASRAGSICTLKIWEGLYHEIHNEPEKEDVLAHLAEWLGGM
ncbi:MAG: lysophospholipase [bacterium]|nr:MAG: lysophospholipase [bacterium]